MNKQHILSLPFIAALLSAAHTTAEVTNPIANAVSQSSSATALDKIRANSYRAAKSGHIQGIDFETEAFQLDHDRSHLLRDKASIQGILDNWIEAGRSYKNMDPNVEGDFFHRGPMMIAYMAMRDAGILDDAFNKDYQSFVEDHFLSEERGPNNRGASYAWGCALAAKAFPNSPKTKEWREYAEAVWNDWAEPGDSYEPAYLRFHARLIKLGEVLGKEKELQSDKMRKTYDRYLSEVSPSGAAVAAGDGGPGQAADLEIFFAAVMEVAPEPQYLWALKKTFLCQQGNTEDNFDAKYPQYKGMTATPPDWSSKVSLRWPETFKQPDKLVLCPSWKEGSPYASFWINDSSTFLYHGGISDLRGDLNHYEVGGVMLMAHRGRFDWPAWNNTFIVAQPDSEYPFPRTREIVEERWYRGSANMRPLRTHSPSVDYPSEKDPKHPQRMVDRSHPVGYLNGNPNALAGSNDSISFKSISLEFAVLPPDGERSAKIFQGRTWWGGYEYRNVCPSDVPVDVMIKDLAVAGPKGEKILLPLTSIPKGMEVTFFPPKLRNEEDFHPHKITAENLTKVIRMVIDPESGRKALRVTTKPGRIRIDFKLPGDVYDITKEYNRLNLSYKYMTPIHNWTRVPIQIGINGLDMQYNLKLDGQQGGILTDAKAVTKGEDSFGTVSYKSIWTHDSTWMRSAVLTKEGVLLVRDEFHPGSSAKGMVGGPVWHLPRAPQIGSLTDNKIYSIPAWYISTKFKDTAEWFDANLVPEYPGFRGYEDYRGAESTSMMIAFAPGVERENGVQFQPKHMGCNDYAVYSKSRLAGGQPIVFTTVLIPHSVKLAPQVLVGNKKSGLSVQTLQDGSSHVEINPKDPNWPYPPMTIDISGDGSWSVKR